MPSTIRAYDARTTSYPMPPTPLGEFQLHGRLPSSRSSRTTEADDCQAAKLLCRLCMRFKVGNPLFCTLITSLRRTCHTLCPSPVEPDISNLCFIKFLSRWSSHHAFSDIWEPWGADTGRWRILHSLHASLPCTTSAHQMAVEQLVRY
jgi:hypothetical protein